MKRISWLIVLGIVLCASPSLAAPTGAVLCYALANNASAQVGVPYTPDSRSAFNAKGGAINVTHNGTGVYSVTCAGVGVGGIGFETVGNVQVTAVGDSNVYCHVNSWTAGILIAGRPPGPRPEALVFLDEFSASVVCFGRGQGGGGGPAPADSEFSLVFIY
jgi:hypothetical protein